MSLPTWPFLYFGGRNMKKHENGVSYFQMTKLCYEGQHFPVAKLIALMFGRHLGKYFRNRCLITLFVPILVHPLDRRKVANSNMQLGFRSGCIGVRYRPTLKRVRHYQMILHTFIMYDFKLLDQISEKTSKFGLEWCEVCASQGQLCWHFLSS